MSRRVALASAAAVAVIAGGSALLAAGTDGDPSHAELLAAAEPIRAEMFATPRGILLRVDRSYSDDRELTGVVRLGQDEHDLWFWSTRYDDHYPVPDPFPVAAGSKVLIETFVEPDCEATDAVPVLTVTSHTSDGTTRSDSYRPTDLEEYAAAVDTYCHLDPEVRTAGSRQEPDGDFTVTLTISNPTREPVLVASEALRIGDTTWQATSTTVPPQSTGELVVRGHGAGCSHINPWTTGHLTLNGVVLNMDEADSEQC